MSILSKDQEALVSLSETLPKGFREPALCALVRSLADRAEKAEEEIEWRRSGDLHTCHANCKRPICVTIRDLRSALAERDKRIAEAVKAIRKSYPNAAKRNDIINMLAGGGQHTNSTATRLSGTAGKDG